MTVARYATATRRRSTICSCEGLMNWPLRPSTRSSYATAEPALRLSEVVVLERDVLVSPTLDGDDDVLTVGRVPELPRPRVETLRPLSDAQRAALPLLRAEVAE